MAQVLLSNVYVERFLLICGEQNAGKSRLLRHMLGDERLGGEIPVAPRFPARQLSRERCLAGRFTSPHEAGETLTKFLDKIASAGKKCRRLNYFSALQPRAANRMPNIVDVCSGLQARFAPERMRVVHLAPDQWGNFPSQLSSQEIDGLRKLNVEVLSIDARRSKHPAEPGNVRILADYFDFS